MPHTSALIASSLGWDNSSIAALRPRKVSARVEQESFAWQQMSQDGSAAEDYAIPSHARRRHIVNGRVTLVPKRPRRIAPRNRLLELHGLAGAIGEQLGLAWTAEQDVQRFIATSAGRLTEHQRLVQRALAETAAYFLLGASHSLANMVLRLVILNPGALNLLSGRDRARCPEFFLPDQHANTHMARTRTDAHEANGPHLPAVGLSYAFDGTFRNPTKGSLHRPRYPYQHPQLEAARFKAVHEARVKIVPRV